MPEGTFSKYVTFQTRDILLTSLDIIDWNPVSLNMSVFIHTEIYVVIYFYTQS